MSEREKKKESGKSARTELYERDMEHEEHRETPLETAGRETDETPSEPADNREKESEEKGT